jgi:hypothetical protein
MKILLITILSSFSLVSGAKCLDVTGTYLMENAGGGMPTCGAGEYSKRIWRKYVQKNCEEVVISKVYKLRNEEICEGPISKRKADGIEYQNEGSDYRSSYTIFEGKHELNSTNVNNGQKSKITYTLNNNNDMVQKVDYSNGHTESSILVRSQVQ